MIKNYLKVAWRNVARNRAHTFINVAGLSVGMAVAILIGLWIYDELSFDKDFENYDHIVQVMQHYSYNGDIGTQNSMPMPLGAQLRQDYKSDLKYVVLSSWTLDHTISWGDKKLTEQGNYMQAEAPELLSLKMLKGTRSVLKDPSSVIISKKLAGSLFGKAEPINRPLLIDGRFNVKVTGVYEDMPENSSFAGVVFIAPWDLYLTTKPYLKKSLTDWGNNSWQIFAQLNPNANVNKVSAHIKDLKADALTALNDKVSLTYKPLLFLFPMSRWHLYAEFENGINTGGAIEFIWMFGIIGLFVVLLACINFMNLSTARSEKRAKEVGIRKTVGSLRSQLIGQFFSESLLVTVFAFIVSLLLVQISLSWFNQVANKHIMMPWKIPQFWLLGLLFAIITGVVAGSYPAFYLSSFQSVKVLKGTFRAGRFAALPRKILVILQFTVSVTLIIGTVIVFRQVQFTKNRPIGYDRNGLIQVNMKNDNIHKQFDAVRNNLLQSGAIIEIAESGSPLTAVYSNSSGYKWKGKDPAMQEDFAVIPVSPGFGKAAGWQLTDGRDFSKTYVSDSTGLILNEAAVKFMNLKHPVGELVNDGRTNFKVIGVVKNMVMSSPYEPVKPAMFFALDGKGSSIIIRVNPALSMRDALSKIEAVFKQYDATSPFDYQFADDEYAKKFAAEERVGKLAGFFTILAIFISCMGLFGMASFMAEQRTKEIGLRKVLGATVFSLWQLMSTEFVLLVFVSLIIAMPLAWYFMNSWIQGYQYRAALSWWIFACTGIGALLITLLTVSYQSIHAALINPVKGLRSE